MKAICPRMLYLAGFVTIFLLSGPAVLRCLEKSPGERRFFFSTRFLGNVIRLNVPQLTKERRVELAKTAKSIGEQGKTALRNVRRDTLDKVIHTYIYIYLFIYVYMYLYIIYIYIHIYIYIYIV